MSQRLIDLNELILSCRTDAAKDLIGEAVSCYEVGAVRASIVTTWTAIFFDLLDKSRELAISGDKSAQALVDRFERAETNGDISAMLKIESEILEVVHRDLELISTFEMRDLKRVQEDRHRCAHPTLDGAGNRFVPSAEIGRAHIVNAVKILLQQPPVQGKAAIEGIIATISSKLFPISTEKAVIALSQTGLARPRSSLVRNVVIVCLKNCLGVLQNPQSLNFGRAFRAILKMQRKAVLEIIKSDFSSIIRSVEDAELSNVVFFLAREVELSSFVEEDQVNRLQSFTSTLSGNDLMYLDDALEVPLLVESAIKRVRQLSVEDISKAVFFLLPEAVGDRLIDLLSTAKSFDESNAVSGVIRIYLRDLNKNQLKLISEVGATNEQVGYAFDYKNLISEISSQIEK